MNALTETRKKLLDDGYKFIRLTMDGGDRGQDPKIKICESFGVWKTHGIYATKVARNREAMRLIREEQCLCLES